MPVKLSSRTTVLVLALEVVSVRADILLSARNIASSQEAQQALESKKIK